MWGGEAAPVLMFLLWMCRKTGAWNALFFAEKPLKKGGV